MHYAVIRTVGTRRLQLPVCTFALTEPDSTPGTFLFPLNNSLLIKGNCITNVLGANWKRYKGRDTATLDRNIRLPLVAVTERERETNIGDGDDGMDSDSGEALDSRNNNNCDYTSPSAFGVHALTHARTPVWQRRVVRRAEVVYRLASLT